MPKICYVNLERGFTLESWQLSRVAVSEEGCARVVNETIIAVFVK